MTEILNITEAKSLVCKKFCHVLFCMKSIIREPSEDFKIILDEGERKMLELFDKEEEKSQD